MEEEIGFLQIMKEIVQGNKMSVHEEQKLFQSINIPVKNEDFAALVLKRSVTSSLFSEKKFPDRLICRLNTSFKMLF